jgi:hypothetical protein
MSQDKILALVGGRRALVAPDGSVREEDGPALRMLCLQLPFGA